MDYCSLVICDISDELELKLQRIINSGIRYIFDLRKSKHITQYRISLNWLTINRSAGILMYKLFQSKVPTYLVDRYITNTSTRPVRGYHLPLSTPFFTKEFLQNSVYVKSSYFWNSLPPKIRHCTTLHSFKKVSLNHQLSLDTQAMSHMRARL